MARNKIELEIRGDDQATRVVKAFQRSFDASTKAIIRDGEKATSTWNKFTKQMLSFRTVMIGVAAVTAGAYGLKRLASYGTEIAASFEQMELKLGALTKGKGAETLERINKWALEMPVNTRAAVDSFTMMMAMGLDPTIAKMQILVDTAVLFGDQAMPRIARSLGQMATLGKLSAEELNQLSEAGINARKYLTEAFGMTVEELQKANVEIEKIIDVIWKGLAEDFGGAATKAQNTWKGLTATFTSYVEEITRATMGAGAFELLKEALRDINAELKEWIDNNDLLFSQHLPKFFDDLRRGVALTVKVFKTLVEISRFLPGTSAVAGMWDLYKKSVEMRGGAQGGATAPLPKMPKMEIRGPGSVTQPQTEGGYGPGSNLQVQMFADMIQGAEEFGETWAKIEPNVFAGIEHLAKGFEETGKEIFSVSEQMKYSIEDNFINALDNVIDKTMSVSDAFKNMVGSILRDLGTMMVRKAMGPLLDTIFSALPFHGGGVVGQPGGMARQVSPLAFVGAPRLHSGLKHDEYPAVLQRGEEVTAKGESRAKVLVDIHGNTFLDDRRLMSLIQSVSAETTAEILPGLMMADVNDDGDMRTMIAHVGRGM